MDAALHYQYVRTQRSGWPKQWLQLLCLAALPLLFCSAFAAAASGSAHTRCNADQFECRDGSCILHAKMCDKRPDCADSSDELNCDYKLCQGPDWFQCAQPHGACISSKLKCNNVENCLHGDDEFDCPQTSSRRPTSKSTFGKDICTKSEFMCEKDKSCIPRDFMCDGKSDCRDNSDEQAGCKETASNCAGFFCSNKKCLVRKEWVCDGFDDCGDGSDERECVELCKPELGKFMCRNKLSCLDLEQACNGKADCSDQSDESESCNSKPDCSTKVCANGAKCQMMPTSGATCYCPKGFRLNKNVCEDVNECTERDDACSQNCENTSGGYQCGCDAGYMLASDNRTCHAQSDEEPLMLYTTQMSIMSVKLRSHRISTVTSNLTKVIGVAYDGSYIYWTNIEFEQETIVRSRTDGSHHEILLTSGLDAPEDLAVDWLTRNIYFTDNSMNHIAVCTEDAITCVVLVTYEVHQPRGIAVWPQRAQMFWTDWSEYKPMIGRASMDGSNSMALVSDNIRWPNGIALDMHHERLYWVDAKLGTIESVRPDGTGRHTVLDGIPKHPYGLAVFEDQLYWSDWHTYSVHACNRFTGKNHRIIAKDRKIFAVHIYHPAKQPKTAHACQTARCSHMCLLAEKGGYTCACPDGMQLSDDQRRCFKSKKKQSLYVGLNHVLLEIEHTPFGRHTISKMHTLSHMISEMAFNSVNGTIFIVDNVHRAISEFDPTNNVLSLLVSKNLGNVTGIAFDHLSHNIYWTDSERHTIEVFSLQTKIRAIVHFFAGMEAPIGLALMPSDGFMYVALRARRHVHIDRLTLSGRDTHVHVFEDDIGDDDIKFAVDYNLLTLFWTDSDNGRISFTDYRKLEAHPFRYKLRRPYSIALVEHDVFWTEQGSTTVFWTHNSNLGPKKSISIEGTKDSFVPLPPRSIPLVGSQLATTESHPCQHNNGGCSHVCVSDALLMNTCLCPAGFVYRDASNRTCIEALDCEFRCRSGECLTLSHRCNNRKDCPDNSDEEGCDMIKDQHRPKVFCGMAEWACHDGTQCIAKDKRCDIHKDCHDSSDEQHCKDFDKDKQCHVYQQACDNGKCVDLSLVCDGTNDCGDNSDETNCKRQLGQGPDSPSSRRSCGLGLFQCNGGSCIASSWECDGKIDCEDGSDEHEKCGSRECPAGMHRCALGQCLDDKLVCDGHNDCGDMSDELNCDPSTGQRRPISNITCGTVIKPMYQCTSNLNLCFELAVKCNGTAECPRGEDEADCGDVCGIYEFQCRSSKQCIRQEFRCDHDKDCSDGSDEVDCEHLRNDTINRPWLSQEQACKPHMFDCKNGECVDMARVCNHFPDCKTGIDEGPQCDTACRVPGSSRKVCEHKCKATPTGAVCSCFDGYRLDSDLRSCVDIDECAEEQPCSQLCENTFGSYRCQCYPDFMLVQDRITCKSIETGAHLLFTSYNEVRNMSLQPPISLNVAWAANDTRINGFDVDIRRQLAYFSSDDEDVLYMVDLQHNRVSAGLAVREPTKVAVDWLTGNVYVVSRASPNQIRVCSFPAKMCGRVVDIPARFYLKALAVDAYHRRLFYVTIRTESFGQPMSQLFMTRLDGSKRELMLRKPNSYVTTLAIDVHKQMLYYTDQHAKTLEALSYRQKSSQKPLVLLKKNNAVQHPSGLSIYENQAYIVNLGAKEVPRCQLYGTRSCGAFIINILNAEDVLVTGRSRQPMPDTNACDHAACLGICVRSDFGYECMCGDSVVPEGTRCPHGNNNEITKGALLMTESKDDAESDTNTSHMSMFWLISGLMLLAMLLIGCGYIYKQRQKRGHRDLNINLHFQNPLATLGNKSVGSETSACSGSSTGTTAASFTAERETLQFGMSAIQKFLRGRPPSSDDLGTEIMLETSRADEVRTLDSSRTGTKPDMLVAVASDDTDATGSMHHGGYGSDDARAQLVP